MNANSNDNGTEVLTTTAAARRLRDLRVALEGCGFDPLDSAEYRQAREVLNDCCGRDIARWKERRGYHQAESDQGREE